jgi:hypothetical protein
LIFTFSISFKKDLLFFSIPILKSPENNFDKILTPCLNSSFWSSKIIWKSAEIGAELNVEIKIDLGLSDGFAIISYGLCLIKGQQPESNNRFLTCSLLKFL